MLFRSYGAGEGMTNPCDNISDEEAAARTYETALEAWSPAYTMASKQCATAEGTQSVNAGLSGKFTVMLDAFTTAIQPLCNTATTARRLLWNSDGVVACGNAKTKTEKIAKMLSTTSDELKVKTFNCRSAKALEVEAWNAFQTAWSTYKGKRDTLFAGIKAWNSWVGSLEPLATAATSSFNTFTETTVPALAVTFGGAVTELADWAETGHCGLTDAQVSAICTIKYANSYAEYVASGSETCPADGTGAAMCLITQIGRAHV